MGGIAAFPLTGRRFGAGEAANEGFEMNKLSGCAVPNRPFMCLQTIRREFQRNFKIAPLLALRQRQTGENVGAIRPARAFYSWDGPVQHWFTTSGLPYEVE